MPINLEEFYSVLIIGIIVGGFFYHVFINKLVNSKKYQKLRSLQKPKRISLPQSKTKRNDENKDEEGFKKW